MSDTATKQQMYIPTQLYYNKAKIRKIEDHEAAAINNVEELRAAKGITYALIFCIPFWLIVIMLVFWLV
jgi:hypothetical protein